MHRIVFAKTITSLRVQQRLLGSMPLLDPDVSNFVIKKLMARIRITEEAMQDSGKGAFIDAIRKEMSQQWCHWNATTDSWMKP